MDPQLYYQVAQRQDTYWWGRARRKMSAALLRRFGVKSHGRFIELGCGTGQNLKQFSEFSPDLVVGVDLSPIALELAKPKTAGASLVRCDISKTLPFADATFDVVTIHNVLHHRWVLDEIDVLVEAERLLRSGGLLLVTEPAFPLLTRSLDAAVMGDRRYRVSEFIEFCRRAGYEVLASSYFTSFGFPLVLGAYGLERLRSMWRGSAKSEISDMAPLHPAINRIMYGLAIVEAKLITTGLFVPFGTTLVCIARKGGASEQ